MIKSIVKKTLILYYNIYKLIFTINYKIFSKINQILNVDYFNITTSFTDQLKRVIIHEKTDDNIDISIFTPNYLCLYRALTFSTKEPETLLWIEEFGKNNAVLFDIGANIGLYSIYHSLVNNGKSYAFEPSFFNLKQLARNINENKCENNVVVVPNPLAGSNDIQKFKYGNIDEGGALSVFSVDYGYDGKYMNSSISNKVIGFSLDYLAHSGIINDVPDLLKIDVDGIEHIILKGAMETISSSKCKSVLVEVNGNFREQEDKVHEILSECGFTFRKKYFNEEIPASSDFKNTGNEIWIK